MLTAVTLLAREGFDQIFFIEGVEVRHVNTARFEPADLVYLRLSQPQHHVCTTEQRRAIGADAGTRCLVVCVTDAGTGART